VNSRQVIAIRLDVMFPCDASDSALVTENRKAEELYFRPVDS